MKQNSSAFSLIELIVWVSISMILMISVWIFVSSGMKNITIQKQILDQSTEITNLSTDFNDILSGDFNIITNTATSITLKSDHLSGKASYYTISETSSTGYCKSDTGIVTKRLLIQNFNPVTLTWVAGFSGSISNNTIYSGTTAIAGRNIFWSDDFADGTAGTWIYLNNPGWLTKDLNDTIFISDSGNNKVIYISWWLAYNLLNESHGIVSPTGLLYNWGKLYILNSGKKELLEMSSKSVSSGTGVDLEFQINSWPKFVNKLTLEVLPNDFIINGTYNTGSFRVWYTAWWIFIPINSDADTIVKSPNNTLTYTFDSTKTIIDTFVYGIKIPSFSGSLWSKPYYIKLRLYDWGIPQYQEHYPYVVNSDNNIKTIADNSIIVLTGWISENYTNISKSWANMVLSDMINGRTLEVASNGNYVANSNMTPTNINQFENSQKLSEFIVKDFHVEQVWNLLTFKIDYYKNFSCYNEKDAIVKTLLIKKVIPN